MQSPILTLNSMILGREVRPLDDSPEQERGGYKKQHKCIKRCKDNA